MRFARNYRGPKSSSANLKTICWEHARDCARPLRIGTIQRPIRERASGPDTIATRWYSPDDRGQLIKPQLEQN
jgi:hypothetical protein